MEELPQLPRGIGVSEDSLPERSSSHVKDPLWRAGYPVHARCAALQLAQAGRASSHLILRALSENQQPHNEQ